MNEMFPATPPQRCETCGRDLINGVCVMHRVRKAPDFQGLIRELIRRGRALIDDAEFERLAIELEQAISLTAQKGEARARRSDPWTSKEAARRTTPTGVRVMEVLKALLTESPAWVDAPNLATGECGGSEGLRRVRELRSDYGWPVERRQHPTRSQLWQYRLPAGAGTDYRIT